MAGRTTTALAPRDNNQQKLPASSMQHHQHHSKPTTATTKKLQHQLPKKKRVNFIEELVTVTTTADGYDRTAVPPDIFSCDVCSTRIPCGIRGFEPYATCETCPEGFDICLMCCGADKLHKKCQQQPIFCPNDKKKLTIKVKDHKHKLAVVDRGIEVVWANDKIDEDTAAACSSTSTMKRDDKATAQSPTRKKAKS